MGHLRWYSRSNNIRAHDFFSKQGLITRTVLSHMSEIHTVRPKNMILGGELRKKQVKTHAEFAVYLTYEHGRIAS